MFKYAKSILVLWTILTGIFIYLIQFVEFDYDYEKYFPQEDQSMIEFNQFRDEFGEDSDFILVGIENKTGIFDIDFLKKVKKLGDELVAQPEIDFVFSPVHNCKYLKKGGLTGVLMKDYLDLNKSEFTEEDSIFIYSNPIFIGSILPKNGKSVTLFLQTTASPNKKEALAINEFLQRKKSEFDFDDFHYSGRIIAQVYFVEKMMNELLFFISTSIVLLVGFLYISFRSWWGVIVPLIIVIVSIIWTIAFMYFTGKSVDLLMIMLPTLIFVVGMSDLVHLLAKYLDELRKGIEKKIALKTAFKEVRWATFLTSFTTAIGFFALVFANIQPIRDFGIYAGFSVFIAYFLAFTLLPSVLYLVDPPKSLIDGAKNNFWDPHLRRLFLYVTDNQRKIVFFVIGLTAMGVYTASNLKINNFILEDLSNTDPVKKDVIFFEENYSGLRPFEAEVYPVGDFSVYDYEFHQELAKLEAYLQNDYTEEGVGFLVSPNTMLREANFVKRGSKLEYRVLPKTERRFDALVRLLNSAELTSMDGADKTSSLLQNTRLISSDSSTCRISGKIQDVGGIAIKEANKKLDEFIAANINPDILKVKLTGTALLIDQNNATLATNLMSGLLLAFAIIALVVGVMFRSVKIALLSLIPNILPLLFITVVMYFTGIDLKISTSLIFTLAFGIAVDDTIHLLAKYKLERRKGIGHIYALKRSYLSSGKAIIVTTLILVGGFLTLIFSSFMSTFYMGLLVSITLFAALILDLLMMPIIILVGLKKYN